MKCEKCGAETDQGSQYVFHYGKKVGQKSTSEGNTITTETDYRILGSDHVFFCNKCVATQYSRDESTIGLSIVFLPMLLGLLFLLRVGFEDATIWLYVLCLALPGVIGLYKGYSYLVRWMTISRAVRNNDNDFLQNIIQKYKTAIEDVGDKWAIEYKKPQLSKLGYDGFFTRSKYRSLKFK